jgi:hypothetical protein
MVSNKYAVIENGVVANVIVAPEEVATGMRNGNPNLVLVKTDSAGVGDLYSDGVFTGRDTSMDYIEARKHAYPDLGEQFDMLFHSMEQGDFEFTEWRNAIRAVKEEFPKGK